MEGLFVNESLTYNVCFFQSLIFVLVFRCFLCCNIGDLDVSLMKDVLKFSSHFTTIRLNGVFFPFPLFPSHSGLKWHWRFRGFFNRRRVKDKFNYNRNVVTMETLVFLVFNLFFLRYNNIGDLGAASLADALKVNSTLKSIAMWMYYWLRFRAVSSLLYVIIITATTSEPQEHLH